MSRRVINEQCYNQEQSWYYKLTRTLDGHKLRVVIRRNAYDFQSYARVERFDGTQWHIIHSEPIEFCKCQSISYVDKNIKPAAFTADVERLLATTREILL